MNKKLSYFWEDDMHLMISGEKMTPEEAYKKYPDYADEIKAFVDEKNNRGNREESGSAGYLALMRLQEIQNISGSASDFVKKYFKIDLNVNVDVENEKLKAFKNIYTQLVNELEYDEKYAKEQKELDKKNGLTALEIKNKDIERTKVDKKGVCTTFAMRLNDELDKLNIPNCQLTLVKDGVQHAVNLYMIKNNLYIADITQDIIFGNMLKLSEIPPVSFSVNPYEYLQGTILPMCYVIDEPNVPIEQVNLFPAKGVIDCVKEKKMDLEMER